MSTRSNEVESIIEKKYRHGFVTDIEADTVPPGLDEQVIRHISHKKGEPQFMLDWRLRAYEHWLTMKEPDWAHIRHAPIDYQAISYYSAPKSDKDRPKSLDEVDPKLLETYEKLGIPLHERAILAGVAVDAVFDSESVATTPGPPAFVMIASRGPIVGSWRANSCAQSNMSSISNTRTMPARSNAAA